MSASDEERSRALRYVLDQPLPPLGGVRLGRPLEEVFLVYRVECACLVHREIFQFVDSEHSESEFLLGFCESAAEAERVVASMPAPTYEAWNPKAEVAMYPQYRFRALARAKVASAPPPGRREG